MSSPYSSELRKVAEKEKPFMEKLNSGDQVWWLFAIYESFFLLNYAINVKITQLKNQQWEAICEIRNAIVGNRRQKVFYYFEISTGFF